MSKEDKIIPLTTKADANNERKTISEEIPLWQKYTLSVEEAAKYFPHRQGKASQAD